MGNNRSYTNTAQDDDEFVTVKTYNGDTKAGKRHGRGIYLYPNGDMYDGEWRKSRKYGYGVYTFSDGKRLEGFFYKDEYIGKRPNEKMRRRMEKKQKYNKTENCSVTEQTDISNDVMLEDNDTPKLKSEGSNTRRNESFRRNKWLRDKYKLSGGQSGVQNNKNGQDLLASGEHNIKRSYSQGDKKRKDDKVNEAKERRESKRLRESIRQKYKLRE